MFGRIRVYTYGFSCATEAPRTPVLHSTHMIHVRLYHLLAERSLSGREEYELAFEVGLRPLDIIHREGFHGAEEEAIVVLVNDEQAGRQMPLADGDRVEFIINMVGG